MEYQIVIGIVAVVIAVLGYFPYLKEVIYGKVKPHAFSWLIWSITQSVAFFASIVKGGGAGAYAVGVPVLLVITVLGFSIFRGEREITLLDKTSLIAALAGIAAWVLTTDPLWSVIIVTAVDSVGFIPTFRKSYKRPGEESITVYAFTGVSLAISLFALQSINAVTVLYPTALVILNVMLVSMILYRRRRASG